MARRGDNFNTKKTDASKDEWLTPPYIVRALGAFDLDPCSPINRPWPTAKKHLTIEDDGLAHDWRGRVWLNPPYGRETFKWMARLAEHKSGIGLIFARTETKGFQREIFGKAHAGLFLKGRLRFFHVTGEPAENTANAPSVLVSYSFEDTERLARSGLVGALVYFGGGNINKKVKFKDMEDLFA